MQHPFTFDARLTDLLVSQGYKLVEDAGVEHGRLTFLHDDGADRPVLLALSHSLRYAGWRAEPTVPPAFRLPGTNHVIEIEPGGAD
ncbi:hypothetical protein ABTH55_18740, partial [Acinetobacter baumannii]